MSAETTGEVVDEADAGSASCLRLTAVFRDHHRKLSVL